MGRLHFACSLGGINGSGQVPDIPNLPQLIDRDTPENVKSRTGFDGKAYNLIFSDEFEQEGRTFWPGDDPFWFVSIPFARHGLSLRVWFLTVILLCLLAGRPSTSTTGRRRTTSGTRPGRLSRAAAVSCSPRPSENRTTSTLRVR